jgi:iron-sulfur cluster assembly protein
MLALTPTAAEAVETIVSQPGLPERAGLRISAPPPSQDGAEAGATLQMGVVEAPLPDDEVIEGAPLYLEQATVQFLDDKVLDADVEGEQVRFSFSEQAEEA